jgi:hypothetical protein
MIEWKGLRRRTAGGADMALTATEVTAAGLIAVRSSVTASGWLMFRWAAARSRKSRLTPTEALPFGLRRDIVRACTSASAASSTSPAGVARMRPRRSQCWREFFVATAIPASDHATGASPRRRSRTMKGTASNVT